MAMGTKNKHNKETGSNIERSDERIAETQEVFTPIHVCDWIFRVRVLRVRK